MLFLKNTGGGFYLPELCRNTTILVIIAAVEVVALILTLILHDHDLLAHFGLISWYCQWWVLMACAVLCLLRAKLSSLTYFNAYLSCLVIMMACFCVVEYVSQVVLSGGSQAIDLSRFARFGATALMVSVMVLQSFVLVGALSKRSKSEVEARLQTLQARIKPHFLFNCLNSIAELVATQPQSAETAIEDLAFLFRAGLESDRKHHSLKSELSLCERYINLERLRLGQNLRMEWAVNVDQPHAVKVPKLIIQPLIENALLHGVQADGSIEVSLDIRETKQDISIVVENTLASLQTGTDQGESVHQGLGIAVDNIRERLFVLFDDQQTFRIKKSEQRYRVLMRFPKSNVASSAT